MLWRLKNCFTNVRLLLFIFMATCETVKWVEQGHFHGTHQIWQLCHQHVPLFCQMPLLTEVVLAICVWLSLVGKKPVTGGKVFHSFLMIFSGCWFCCSEFYSLMALKLTFGALIDILRRFILNMLLYLSVKNIWVKPGTISVSVPDLTVWVSRNIFDCKESGRTIRCYVIESKFCICFSSMFFMFLVQLIVHIYNNLNSMRSPRLKWLRQSVYTYYILR